MTAADFAPVIQGVATVLATIVTALAAIYVPRAIAAFELRTGISLTDQQRATVIGAAATAAGIIQTKIDQGLIKVADVNVNSPTVRAEAIAAVLRVPDSAAALKTTPDAMAAIIVGKVDTKPVPAVVVVPVAPPQPIGPSP